MSISTKLQPFRNASRIVINDKFIGDDGALQLAQFLFNHKNVTSLQIKSNDISSQGFIPIFQALIQNQAIKELNIQYNSLGINDYVQWYNALSDLITSSVNLSRLNISNNKISNQGFSKICDAICSSRSLKLLQIRYNNINSETIQQFSAKLKQLANQSLLFVQLAGNKIKREAIDSLESTLSKNRARNPITKEKLMGITNYSENPKQAERTHNVQLNSAQQIPYDNMTSYLQQMLGQNRRQAAESKAKLQRQLAQLLKRQKLDQVQLNLLQNKCGQLIIVNRNLKFQLDRSLSELDQIQRDQQSQKNFHEQKFRQANRQLQELQLKYEQTQSRMNKEHEMKMKQIVRDWQARLRNVEQKIRQTQNDNNIIENQIRKNLDKRQRLKLECIDQETIVRSTLEQQESFLFNVKARNLQSKLRQLQNLRDGYAHRNQQLVFELEKLNQDNLRQISELEDELSALRLKQVQFNSKSKDFFTKNEKIKAEIQMKKVTIEKLESQIARVEDEIQQKRQVGQGQLYKVKQSFQSTKYRHISQKQNKVKRLNQAQNSLRQAQLQNSKLRQDYALLAQKLQVSLSLAVHKVFEENQLYQ